MRKKIALVLGGTGFLGEAVVNNLRAKEVQTTFTYWQSKENAQKLQEKSGAIAKCLNLNNFAEVQTFFQNFTADTLPNVLIHCAGKNQTLSLSEINESDWSDVISLNARSAFWVCQALVPRLKNGGDIVFIGAFDGTQVIPAPAHFAASQGALLGMTRSLAKELGPKNIRVNLVTLGVLDGGNSENLEAKLRDDYKAFSALRRIGTAKEASNAIVWLGLENSYMTGKVLSVNGGL